MSISPPAPTAGSFAGYLSSCTTLAPSRAVLRWVRSGAREGRGPAAPLCCRFSTAKARPAIFGSFLEIVTTIARTCGNLVCRPLAVNYSVVWAVGFGVTASFLNEFVRVIEAG